MVEAPQSEHPPLTAKESMINRFKPIWRFLLISNLALGAYMFAKARKKNVSIGERRAAKKDMEDGKVSVEAFLEPTTTTSIPETASPLSVVPKVKEPIPENQQHELFKWILEEKRKVKPKDPEEKKRIDEEKAILKQFIGAKSIPTL